jgi:hypothetical protein
MFDEMSDSHCYVKLFLTLFFNRLIMEQKIYWYFMQECITVHTLNSFMKTLAKVLWASCEPDLKFM